MPRLLGSTDPLIGMVADGPGMIITAYVGGHSIEKVRVDFCESLMTHKELLRERVAKLAVQMTHLNEKLDDTHKRVEEMHAILLQAKGALRVIIGLAGVAGLASGLVAKFVP